MPDGKVYMVYARFFNPAPDKTDMEFVLAQHEEFRFDYKRSKLIPKYSTRFPVYSEMVDKPNPIFQILHISREVKSYAEAVQLLYSRTGNVATEPVFC